MTGPGQPGGSSTLTKLERVRARHALHHLVMRATGTIAGLSLPAPDRGRLVDVIDSLTRHLSELRRVVTAAGLAGGQAREIQELTRWAEGNVAASAVDELIHDDLSAQASELNNGGLGAQVAYLVELYGADRARTMLECCQAEGGGTTPARHGL